MTLPIDVYNVSKMTLETILENLLNDFKILFWLYLLTIMNNDMSEMALDYILEINILNAF